MDFGTIITILILVGSFIYSIVQNARAYREQRPGQDRTDDDSGFPFPDDPFSETRRQPAEPAEEERDPSAPEAPGEAGEQQPPYDPGGPYPRELLDRETSRTTEQEKREAQPYQREAGEGYSRSREAPYQKQSGTSYQRKRSQAYKRRKAAKKGKAKLQQRLRRKQLKQFDPVQAVIYSEVVNRPKYLDDPSSKPRF